MVLFFGFVCWDMPRGDLGATESSRCDPEILSGFGACVTMESTMRNLCEPTRYGRRRMDALKKGSEISAGQWLSYVGQNGAGGILYG